MLPILIADMRDFLLAGIQSLIPLADYPIDVTQNHISKSHTDQQLADSNACRPCPINDNLDLSHPLASHLDGIKKSRSYHNRRTVLVVMKNGNITKLFQPPLNLKASGSRNILQINAAKAF